MVEKELTGRGPTEGGAAEPEAGAGVRTGVEGGADEDMCTGVTCTEVVHATVTGTGKNEISPVVDEKVGLVGVVST